MGKEDLLAIIAFKISWHNFCVGQGGAMSSTNYHIGAIDTLRSLRDEINEVEKT